MLHSAKHYWVARQAKFMRRNKLQYNNKRKIQICEKAFYRTTYKGKLGLNNWRSSDFVMLRLDLYFKYHAEKRQRKTRA